MGLYVEFFCSILFNCCTKHILPGIKVSCFLYDCVNFAFIKTRNVTDGS